MVASRAILVRTPHVAAIPHLVRRIMEDHLVQVMKGLATNAKICPLPQHLSPHPLLHHHHLDRHGPHLIEHILLIHRTQTLLIEPEYITNEILDMGGSKQVVNEEIVDTMIRTEVAIGLEMLIGEKDIVERETVDITEIIIEMYIEEEQIIQQLTHHGIVVITLIKTAIARVVEDEQSIQGNMGEIGTVIGPQEILITMEAIAIPETIVIQILIVALMLGQIIIIIRQEIVQVISVMLTVGDLTIEMHGKHQVRQAEV